MSEIRSQSCKDILGVSKVNLSLLCLRMYEAYCGLWLICSCIAFSATTPYATAATSQPRRRGRQPRASRGIFAISAAPTDLPALL